MDGAADGSNPDNYENFFTLHIKFRHGLHYCLC